jgi:hypothetical protein
VAGLTLRPPASFLPRAVAAAAVATARATTRFATPINVALPPPLHALPLDGAVPRTSLDGGDAAAELAALRGGAARSGGSAARSGAEARGDRFRAGVGAAQALGVLPPGAAAATLLPHDRARGKARRPRPNSCPPRGWPGGAQEGGRSGGGEERSPGGFDVTAMGAAAAVETGGSSLDVTAMGSLVAPQWDAERGGNVTAMGSLMASQWDPERGLDGGGSAFGRGSGAPSPPPSRGGSVSGGGFGFGLFSGGGGGGGASPLRPSTGLSRTASPRLMAPKTYGAALAQLTAFSAAAATARGAAPAGGAAARGLESQLVSSRKGGVF